MYRAGRLAICRMAHLHEDTVAGYTSLQPTDGCQPASAGRAASNHAVTPGNAQMAEGTIKKLTDRGFGFINTGKGQDLFFHSSSVQVVTFDDLKEGQKVSYTEGRGPKGPCAENVTPA